MRNSILSRIMLDWCIGEVAHYKCNRDLYAVAGIYGYKSPVFTSINPLHL